MSKALRITVFAASVLLAVGSLVLILLYEIWR